MRTQAEAETNAGSADPERAYFRELGIEEVCDDEQLREQMQSILDIAPQDDLEMMLSVKLVVAHRAACECFRGGIAGGVTPDGFAYLKLADRLSRTFVLMLGALDRHRERAPEISRHRLMRTDHKAQRAAKSAKQPQAKETGQTVDAPLLPPSPGRGGACPRPDRGSTAEPSAARRRRAGWGDAESPISPHPGASRRPSPSRGGWVQAGHHEQPPRDARTPEGPQKESAKQPSRLPSRPPQANFEKQPSGAPAPGAQAPGVSAPAPAPPSGNADAARHAPKMTLARAYELMGPGEPDRTTRGRRMIYTVPPEHRNEILAVFEEEARRKRVARSNGELCDVDDPILRCP